MACTLLINGLEPCRRLLGSMTSSKCSFERRHVLPDGMALELLYQPAASSAPAPVRPPLLFVHGSYHGAWCWRERWMPFFAAAGYDCYAVSLRGQGVSDKRTPAGEPLKVSGDLRSLADDLASVVAALPAPPVLVAHSFGALVSQAPACPPA